MAPVELRPYKLFIEPVLWLRLSMKIALLLSDAVMALAPLTGRGLGTILLIFVLKVVGLRMGRLDDTLNFWPPLGFMALTGLRWGGPATTVVKQNLGSAALYY